MGMQSKTEETGKPEKYEIEDAVNTLLRAEEIKKNKKLMPHVAEKLKEKQNAINSIADIEELAESKKEEAEEDEASEMPKKNGSKAS